MLTSWHLLRESQYSLSIVPLCIPVSYDCLPSSCVLIERYMGYTIQQRDANGGVSEVVLKPPDVAVDAYFMALAALAPIPSISSRALQCCGPDLRCKAEPFTSLKALGMPMAVCLRLCLSL